MSAISSKFGDMVAFGGQPGDPPHRHPSLNCAKETEATSSSLWSGDMAVHRTAPGDGDTPSVPWESRLWGNPRPSRWAVGRIDQQLFRNSQKTPRVLFLRGYCESSVSP